MQLRTGLLRGLWHGRAGTGNRKGRLTRVEVVQALEDVRVELADAWGVAGWSLTIPPANDMSYVAWQWHRNYKAHCSSVRACGWKYSLIKRPDGLKADL